MTNKTEEAVAIIADFGSALMLDSPLVTTAQRIGTPGYIAPEIYGNKPFGLSCDVWSLGCMLHLLLCGKYVFWDDNPKVRSKNVLKEKLDLKSDPVLSSLSADCKDLLQKMLTKDAALRPTIQQVLQHRWLQRYH